MDRSLAVTTPESISFSYDLAGLGSRFLALAIDMLIQIALVVAIVAGFASAGYDGGEAAWASNAVRAVTIFVLFLIFFGYFIVFEALWDGRTPGKRALGIRVVRDGGYPVDFGSAVIRNLVRVLEATLGFYAISAIAALVSSENKRLGDLAAGTVVVRESRAESLAHLQQTFEDGVPLLDAQAQAVVDRFLARRSTLAPGVRGLLAARIAGRIRPLVTADLRSLDDEALLERVSAR